jgi:hypothetical protein
LCTAGVLDRLRREEYAVVGGAVVVGAVWRRGGVARLTANPFEEEDYAVDGAGSVNPSLVSFYLQEMIAPLGNAFGAVIV